MENVIYDNRHDINLIKKALTSLETPPTYKSPSASLTIKPNLIEQGRSTQVNLQHNYVKNDAGDIISVKYYIGPKEVESPCPI